MKKIAVISGGILLILFPAGAKAVEINISPSLQEVVIESSDIKKPVTITIANTSDKLREFSISVVDFGSLGESGGLAFLGATTNEDERKYGLSPWLPAPTKPVRVPAKGTQNVTLEISNRSNFAPGGHYAAIIVSPTQKSGPDQVQIQQQAASLVLVKKLGGEKYNIGIQDINYQNGWFKLPTQVSLKLVNNGNVHGVPRGLVRIVDPSGNIVSKGVLNQESSFILPEATRNFKVTPEKLKAYWKPGKYSVVAQVRYEGSSEVQTLKREFWYVGWVGLAAIMAVILLMIATLLLVKLGVFNKLRNKIGRRRSAASQAEKLTPLPAKSAKPKAVTKKAIAAKRPKKIAATKSPSKKRGRPPKQK